MLDHLQFLARSQAESLPNSPRNDDLESGSDRDLVHDGPLSIGVSYNEVMIDRSGPNTS